MNPEIALQMLSDIAKISGTAMSLFIAVIIFALRDKDLAKELLKKSAERLVLILVVILQITTILSSLYMMMQIDITQAYPTWRISLYLILFGVSLALMLSVFIGLVWEKYNALKEN